MPVDPEMELEVLSGLAICSGEVELDARRVEVATGCDFSTLLELAELLKAPVTAPGSAVRLREEVLRPDGGPASGGRRGWFAS